MYFDSLAWLSGEFDGVEEIPYDPFEEDTFSSYES